MKLPIGPGLITGAADDDPSGIATYSQTGAQYGYGQLWTAVFLLPLMIAVQEASARIGAVKRQGIAAVIKENYGHRVLYPVVALILIANILNLGADLGAMAAAAKLIIPLPTVLLTVLFAATILLLEIFTSYHTYARVLKWLSLTLLAYPLTVLVVHIPFLEVIKATLIPHLEFNLGFAFILTGVIGTTISPYMFFWQASEENEEVREQHFSKSFLKRLRIDNFIGMIASQVATWSIIVVAATVLNRNGITNINSATDAAKALEPLVSSFPNAGSIAKTIFALGIVGLGLLSVPILSGSAAYALAEAVNWRSGFNRKLGQAPGFYSVIIIATIIGMLINFVGIDPIRALIYVAVINGVLSVPLIFFIGKIAGSQKIMGQYASGRLSKSLVWLTFFATLASVASLLVLH